MTRRILKGQGVLSHSFNENMDRAVDNFDVSRRMTHRLTGYHCAVRRSRVLYLESSEFKYRHGDLLFWRFPWCFSDFRIKWQDISTDFRSHLSQTINHH